MMDANYNASFEFNAKMIDNADTMNMKITMQKEMIMTQMD